MTDEHWLVRALLGLYPKDYRARYGAEMLAVSRERAGRRRWPSAADVADLLGGAARVRLSRMHDVGRDERLREGLSVVGVLAPVLMLSGLAAPWHDMAWVIYHGGLASGVPWLLADVGPVVPFLPWAVVAVVTLLGWRRAAAVLAWLTVAGTLLATAADLVFPPVVLGGWLSLGLVAAVALHRATRSGSAVVGGWRLLGVAAGVVLVWGARVAGHGYSWADPVAWLLLGTAVVVACRPRTVAGRWALLVLAAPAMSATAAFLATDVTPGVYGLPWPWLVLLFQVVPLVVAAAAAVTRPVRTRWRRSGVA